MRPVAVTEIPIEALFALVGGLAMIIYADIKYEIRRLRRESHARSNAITALRIAMSFVCRKLDIPYPRDDDPPDR